MSENEAAPTMARNEELHCQWVFACQLVNNSEKTEDLFVCRVCGCPAINTKPGGPAARICSGEFGRFSVEGG